MQMAPPRRAKVRTNWCSYIAAFTLSLFSVTMILKQLFGCFFCAHSYFHHPILTTRGQRRSISVLYHWLESDRLGLDMLISSTIDPAQFSLIIGWQLVLALDSYSNLQLPPAALLFVLRKVGADPCGSAERFTLTRKSAVEVEVVFSIAALQLDSKAWHYEKGYLSREHNDHYV